MNTSKIREELKKNISGEVVWKKEFIDYYSVDASSYQIRPKIIVIPKTEEDVVFVVKYAKKAKISVTARGAGTGLVGSALNDGIILDLKNLDDIRIRKDTVRVGAGTIKGVLDKKLAEKGKFFPPNPSVGIYCTVGGMIGNNASGSRSLKYGSMIDNIKEITIVNGKGERITLPKDKKTALKITEFSKNIEREKFPIVSKNSSGYRLDVTKLPEESHKVITGSEGTLGIILSAELKITEIPSRRVLSIIEYNSLADAAKNCIDILSTSPSAVEFVDKLTLSQIPEKFDKKTKCLLFVEHDSDIRTKKLNLKRIVSGKIVNQTTQEDKMKQWWRYRDSSLFYSLKSIKPEYRVPHVIEDATVPIENLEELFSIIKKINHKFGTKSIMYGHAGNANIHVRLISDRRKIKKIREIADEYFEEVIKMGGTITGEHGDGIARSEFVKKQYGDKNYQIFKRLKKFFDPENILNPCKIISAESTILENLESFEKI